MVLAPRWQLPLPKAGTRLPSTSLPIGTAPTNTGPPSVLRSIGDSEPNHVSSIDAAARPNVGEQPLFLCCLFAY